MSKSIKTIFVLLVVFCVILGIVVMTSRSVDCIWYGTAKAWIDANENGFMDDTEIPLAGISVFVDDTQNGYFDVASPIQTDVNGNANLDVWLPGCPDVSFEVYTDVPDGYRRTTQPRLEVSKNFWGSLDTETIYYFGFVSEIK